MDFLQAFETIFYVKKNWIAQNMNFFTFSEISFADISYVVFTRILILLEFLLGEYNFEVDCIVIHDSEC